MDAENSLFHSEKTAPTIVRLQTDPKAVFQYAAFVGASSPKVI